MITAKTGTGSSWEQFLRLKAQAQVRNTGFTGKIAAKQSAQGTPAMQAARPPVSVPSSALPATMKNYSNTTDPVAMKQTKILGGTFDAWA